jgi:hypothetical protein
VSECSTIFSQAKNSTSSADTTDKSNNGISDGSSISSSISGSGVPGNDSFEDGSEICYALYDQQLLHHVRDTMPIQV